MRSTDQTVAQDGAETAPSPAASARSVFPRAIHARDAYRDALEARNAGRGLMDGQNAYRAALWQMRPALGGILGFSAVLNVLMLTGSIYMLQVYDRVLSSRSVPTLIGLFAIVVVLYGFLGLYDFLRSRLLSRAALRLDQTLGPQAFRAMVGAGGGAKAGGEQPLRDLDSLRGFLSGPAVTALFDVPFVPLYLAVLFVIHPLLGWVTVAGAGVTALIALANQAFTAGPTQGAATLDGAERDFAETGRRNAETIVAMGMAGAVTARWQRMHHDTLALGQRGSDPSEMLAAGSRAFRMLLQSAILSLGAWLVIRGEMSGGMIIASSVLTGRALMPVDQLIGQWRSLGRAIAAHRKLDAAFTRPDAGAQPIALPPPTGAITVSHLTFLPTAGQGARQGAEARPILSDVSFTLASGDGLGVIGSSASGKSTLARLLVGALSPDKGEIRFDAATPDQWDPAVLGTRIGYLPQVVEMMPGTIRDNIARFHPEATDEGVIAAARLTGVHEMILRLPDGYATRVGGATGRPVLSGGQLQRIGIARAVYGMPAIVVLDEPNSNLDIAGDAALSRTIAALRDAGSTVIVMAHRPSALAAVNKLLVLAGGKVRAFGDKAAVLANHAKTQGQGQEQEAEVAAAKAPTVLLARAATLTRLRANTPRPGSPDLPTSQTAAQPVPQPVPQAVPQTVPHIVRMAGPPQRKQSA
jgi:ATP-binding cassette subfamily C protein